MKFFLRNKTPARAPRNSDLLRYQVATAKADLQWKRAKYLFVGALAVIGVGSTLISKLDLASSNAQVAPVVRIEGGIAGGGSRGSADAVIKNLKLAFEQKNAQGVVLYIDSPGGAPAEAERINRYLTRMQEETKKPVYAVCAGMCASAGYMIAMHADEIYAGRYSLVGSIGAVLSSWNFADAIHKFGVQHNAYASGGLKAMLNPFSPIKSDDANKAQNLVNGMGHTFADEVKALRKDKLKPAGGDLFTGEVWDGQDALARGLIDRIGTLEDLVRDKFPKDAVARDMSKASQGFSFAKTLTDALVQSVQELALANGGFQVRD